MKNNWNKYTSFPLFPILQNLYPLSTFCGEANKFWVRGENFV